MLNSKTLVISFKIIIRKRSVRPGTGIGYRRKMAFTENTGVVAAFLHGSEQIRQSVIQRTFPEIAVSAAVVGIKPGQNRTSCRQAPGACGITIPIIGSFLCQAVDLRRFYRLPATVSKYAFV